MSKSKCPSCGALSIRPAATKCPACQAWVKPPRLGKRRLRLSPLGVVGLTVGLSIAGMISGVVAAITAQGRRAPQQASAPGNAAENPENGAPNASASSGAGTDSAPPGTVASVATDPPAAEGKFVKTEQVRLDAPPVDIVFSADDSFFFVMTEDGSLRAHDAATGAEKRRIKLPGRGKSLKYLPGSRIAVLGLPAELVVVDDAAWAAGKPQTEVLLRAPIRDVVDLVAFDDPAKFVAISGQGGRVMRLSNKLTAIEAEFVSAPPPRALALLRLEKSERVVMLFPGLPSGDPGVVAAFDPANPAFGASRTTWSAVVDPRIAERSGSDKLLLFDGGTASVIDFSLGAERRVAPAGAQPIAVFRWVGDRAITIGATGNASVVSFAKREVQGTLALGAIPSAAVGTPDRRVVVVALGGGLRGRGAKTVVLAGEPLAVETTVETGEGSHMLAISPKGAVVAVGAIAGRSVTLLVRK